RPAGEPRQRHGPPELRDVVVLHQPDAGADRAVDQSGQVSQEGLHAAQAPRREGRAAASRQDRRQAHQDERQAGELHRPAAAGAVQAGSLPVLIDDLIAILAPPAKALDRLWAGYKELTGLEVDGPKSEAR